MTPIDPKIINNEIIKAALAKGWLDCMDLENLKKIIKHKVNVKILTRKYWMKTDFVNIWTIRNNKPSGNREFPGGRTQLLTLSPLIMLEMKDGNKRLSELKILIWLVKYKDE